MKSRYQSSFCRRTSSIHICPEVSDTKFSRIPGGSSDRRMTRILPIGPSSTILHEQRTLLAPPGDWSVHRIPEIGELLRRFCRISLLHDSSAIRGARIWRMNLPASTPMKFSRWIPRMSWRCQMMQTTRCLELTTGSPSSSVSRMPLRARISSYIGVHSCIDRYHLYPILRPFL